MYYRNVVDIIIIGIAVQLKSPVYRGLSSGNRLYGYFLFGKFYDFKLFGLY